MLSLFSSAPSKPDHEDGPLGSVFIHHYRSDGPSVVVSYSVPGGPDLPHAGECPEGIQLLGFSNISSSLAEASFAAAYALVCLFSG
jgi:hypothetical protein